MKHILFFGAAVAASAAAIQAADTVPCTPAFDAVTLSETLGAPSRVAKVPARAPESAAPDASELPGNYSSWGRWREYDPSTGGLTSSRYYSMTVGYLEQESGNEFTLYGLGFATTDNALKATYNRADSTLTIPWNQPFEVTYTDGSKGKLMIYVVNINGKPYQPSDIVLKYQPRFETFAWRASTDEEYRATSAIIFGPADQIGAANMACYELQLGKVNTYMQWNPGVETNPSQRCYIRTNLVDGAYLDIYNMFDTGFEYPFTFYLDQSVPMLYCEGQMITDLNILFDNPGASSSDCVGSVVDIDGNTEFEMNLALGSYADTGGTFTQIYSPLIGVEYPSGILPALYYNTSIIFNGDLLETASDVRIEAPAADAPAEYYNLQGVRVAEPTAGGIYIRRQGAEVTKMMVR